VSPPERRRRPTRLAGHDYASPGWYVVTICTQDRALLLGEVRQGVVRFSDAGLMVERWWKQLPSRFPGIALDVHVVMPNHLHGIVIVHDPLDLSLATAFNADLVGRDVALNVAEYARPVAPTASASNPGGHAGPPLRGHTLPAGEPPSEVNACSLTDVIGWFKTMTTNEYIRGVKTLNWEPFNRHLWQRSFYDTMIRSDRHLYRARTYIEANPFNWDTDIDNPNCETPSPK
jgi:putative transposase